MSAEELPQDLLGHPTTPQSWTVASISRDGTRMLLVDADGNEMSVAVAPDALPRRSEKTTVNQGQTPTLRPRDIQARIRSGESPESVADAAGTTLERIMPFAAPVMAEREHMAGRAQKASVRRQATESTARSLGDAVALQLSNCGASEENVEWDAWRRPDGRWALVALYTTSARSGAGEFSFDPPGNFVSLDNDDARWLVDDLPVSEQPTPVADDLRMARERRESRVDETAAEVTAQPGTASSAPAPTYGEDRTVPHPPMPSWTPEPSTAAEPPADSVPDERTEAVEPVEHPVAEAPAAPKKPKRRGRASIPSWDEIMFGGGPADTAESPEPGADASDPS